MESSVDLNKVCRACLSDSGPFKELFVVCTPEMYKYCTSVEVSKTDNLPKQICMKCLETLNKLFFFKEVAIRSDNILKKQVLTDSEQGLEESHVNDNEEDCTVQIDKQSASDDGSITEVPKYKPVVKRRKRVSTPKKSTRMKCLLCEKSFQKYEGFEAHMRTHFGKRPDVLCEFCNKVFSNYKNLQSHMRTHTTIREYQCRICGKQFAYLNVLKNHELIHEGVKNFACHVCNATFVHNNNLKRHLETHTNQKNYGCVHCGKMFAQRGTLKSHLIRHTGIKNIICSVCDMRFYIKGDLYKHMKSHSKIRPYACPHCNKSFKSKSFQIVHIRTHTGERPYPCDHCPKKFRSWKDMSHHRMIHTGERPHKCTLCGRAFIQKTSLNRHIKSHEKKLEVAEEVDNLSDGEQIYACDICPKKFNEVKDMYNHLVIHIGKKKPYKCTMCGWTFEQKALLVAHMKSHGNIQDEAHNQPDGERPYPCDLCAKKFRSLKDKRHHRMTHTGEKPHKCSVCGHAFIQKTSLNRHIKIHEKKEVFQEVIEEVVEEAIEEGLEANNLSDVDYFYACDFCPAKFPEEKDVYNHLLSHAFKQKASLTDLMKSNENNQEEVIEADDLPDSEELYSCDICPKKFRVPKDRRDHLLSHAGERETPYKCTLCDSAFTYKTSLTDHTKRHEDIQKEKQNEPCLRVNLQVKKV